MSLEHVCLDCDGTIYPETQATLDALYRVIIPEYARQKSLQVGRELTVDEVWDEYVNSHRNLGSHTQVFKMEELEYEVCRTIRTQAKIADILERDQKLVDVFEYIKRKGLQVSILTTSEFESCSAILDKLGIREYVEDDWIVSPSIPGVKPKPSVTGYQYIMDRLGHEFPREDILMVGDRVHYDLERAKEYGWKTLLVTWTHVPIQVDPKYVDFWAHDIYDLPEIIDPLLLAGRDAARQG